jgi:hypothetical protein
MAPARMQPLSVQILGSPPGKNFDLFWLFGGGQKIRGNMTIAC